MRLKHHCQHYKRTQLNYLIRSRIGLITANFTHVRIKPDIRLQKGTLISVQNNVNNIQKRVFFWTVFNKKFTVSESGMKEETFAYLRSTTVLKWQTPCLSYFNDLPNSRQLIEPTNKLYFCFAWQTHSCRNAKRNMYVRPRKRRILASDPISGDRKL